MKDLITVNAKDATHTGVQIQLDGKSQGDKEWRNLLRRARRNNYPLLKQVLVDYIKGFVKMARATGTETPRPDVVLAIDLGCGHSATYKTYDDIPETDVPCSCGNPKHWLIRYQDLRKTPFPAVAIG